MREWPKGRRSTSVSIVAEAFAGGLACYRKANAASWGHPVKAGDIMGIVRPVWRSNEPAGAPPPLAVVVVTYNSASVLEGLLDSLDAGLEGIERRRIVVVDNNSHDTSVDVALFHPSRPEVIRTGRNSGYAAGINAAAKAIPADADMLILNPDIRLFPGAARVLQDRLRGRDIGIVVPRIVHPDGDLALSLRREPSIVTAWSEALLGGRLSTRLGTGEIVGRKALYDRGGVVEWATGAALMISAHARREVGAWDESFFLYSEEVDFMRRTRECGLSVEYVRRAEATHIGGAYRDDPFLSGLMIANRIRDYGRRHGVIKTTLFRLGVAVGAAVRSPLGAAHRASLRAALTAPRT